MAGVFPRQCLELTETLGPWVGDVRTALAGSLSIRVTVRTGLQLVVMMVLVQLELYFQSTA
jgi:hypothetical protein